MDKPRSFCTSNPQCILNGIASFGNFYFSASQWLTAKAFSVAVACLDRASGVILTSELLTVTWQEWQLNLFYIPWLWGNKYVNENFLKITFSYQTSINQKSKILFCFNTSIIIWMLFVKKLYWVLSEGHHIDIALLIHRNSNWSPHGLRILFILYYPYKH